MTKKIRNKKANYFDNGGFSWKKGAGFKENMSNAFDSGALNSAIGATGAMLGQGISGGFSTGVGNVTQGLSTMASAIPGPWGAVAGAGLNVVGGLVNRLFGSQINEQAVSNFRNQNTQMANTVLNADNYDDLLNQYSDVTLLGDISKSQVGKDGLFSNKAKNLTASLNRDRDFANERYLSSVRNTADNIRTNEMLNANYAAYGGPLTMRYTGTMSPFGNTFAKGGNMNTPIKKKSKLNSTLVSLFGEKDALELTNEYNELKKELQEPPKKGSFGGGSMSGSGIGGRFDTIQDYSSFGTFNEAFDKAYGNKESMFKYGEKYYNTRKENNPIREINNRLIGNTKDRIGLRYKDQYDYRIGPVIHQGLERIPMVSEDFPLTISDQYLLKSLNKKAFGGNLLTNGAVWDNGVTVIGNGGTHEENPMEGVPMGVDEQGIPNLVEEGEVIFNDYVFSNRLSPTKEMKKKYKYKGDTFADVAKNLQKESEERPNDPISKRGLQDSMLKLLNLQEIIRQDNETIGLTNKFSGGGPKSRPKSTKVPYFPINRIEPLGIDESWNTTSSSNSKISKGIQLIPLPELALLEIPYDKNLDGTGSSKKSFDLSSLRYAPVLGAAIGLSNSLFNKPDYSSANALLKASRDANRYSPISYSPIGDYMQYNPFDKDFYATKLRDNFAATTRALLNSSLGSRAAAASSLLSNNYNYLTKLGDLYRQAEEYNLALKLKVADFNRATNMANAEMGLKVSMANQDALSKSRQGNYLGIMNAIQMRDAIDARRGASLSANLSNLFTSLGNVGIDYHNRKDRNFYIENVAPNLPLSEIDRLYGREAVNKAAKDRGISLERLKELGFSKGGKLNIKNKKRKGFTI